jgi:predicted dehydrogenase
MEKIRTAVIGVGAFGDTHAKTYYLSEKVDLAMVCDLNEERAKEAAEKYDCAFTTDYEEIANDPSIEVVSVVTPDFAHLEPSLAMIESGKNIIVEKPLATNVEDAEKITNAAKEKGVRFMTDFQNRWNPPAIHAKQMLDDGKMGFPVSGYIRLSNHILVTEWLSWPGKSGPQWFLGPHIVDLIRWLFGQEVKQVFATGRKTILKELGVDTYDSIQAQLIFEDSFATIDTSWIVPPSWPGLDFYIDILGSEGKMVLEPTKGNLNICSDKFSWPFISGRQDAFENMFGFFREPIIHFIDCVRDGTECIVGVDDGLAVTKIIVAIEESIKSGKVVEL